jgi:hypothetical protein
MSDDPITFLDENGALVARIDAAAFPRDAVYAAAFTFIDRAFVRLERPDATHVDVVLRTKEGAEITRAEIEEAFADARLHVSSAEAGRAWVEGVVLGALGAPDAAPPVERPAPLPELAPEDLAAFDDPLGIAKSWEEKHKKR